MRLTFLLFIIINVNLHSFGQKTSWGITAGFTGSRINSNELHLIKDKSIGDEANFRERLTSGNIGLIVEHQFKSPISFQTGLILNTRGGNYLYDDYNDLASFFYIDIPQILRLNLKNENFTFFFDFGQSISVALSGYCESLNEKNLDYEIYNIKIGDDYERFDYAMVFGSGFSMNKVGKGKLSFQYRYFLDLNNSTKSDVLNEHVINYFMINCSYSRPFKIKEKQ